MIPNHRKRGGVVMTPPRLDLNTNKRNRLSVLVGGIFFMPYRLYT